MMVKFEADLNSRRFEEALKLFSSNLGGIFKQLMTEVGREMAADAKSRAAGAFTSRTGNLIRQIKFFPTDTGGVLTTRKSLAKTMKARGAFYASFVERGTESTAKKGKYLVFKIDGEWKKVPSVKTRPRPFMRPVYDEYWAGSNPKGYKLLAEALWKKMNEYLGE
jgi:hypothetical protein